MKVIHNLNRLIKGSPTVHGFLAAFLALSLFSCSSDAEPAPVEPEEDGLYNLTLSIPEISFGNSYLSSRDGDEPASPKTDALKDNEGKLSSLYLVIFKKDEEDPREVYEPVFCDDIKTGYSFRDDELNLEVIPVFKDGAKNAHLTDIYEETADVNKCHLKLGEGKYKFYLLGNVYEYWKAEDKTKESFLDAIKTEQGIKTLSLSFTGLIEDYLPMVCMAENVCTNRVGTELTNGGVFEITNEDVNTETSTNKNLYAPLTILCSKVRYTILFDNTTDTGFSKDIKGTDINFTFIENEENVKTNVVTRDKGVWIKDLNAVTNLGTPSSQLIKPQDDDGLVYSSLSQTYYPNEDKDNDTENTYWYLDITKIPVNDGKVNSPSNLTVLSKEDEWEISNKRAWQGGPIYIPENQTAYKTSLNFFNNGKDGNPEYSISLRLDRGTFYDVVAKITSASTMEVKVFIKVNAWTYQSHNVSW